MRRRAGSGVDADPAESLPGWPVFPEVPAALEEARGRGWRLAILSNTDRDLLDASMDAIGVPFDLSIVASEIGSYKPAERHWRAFEETAAGCPTSTPPRASSTTSRPRTRSASRASGSTASARTPATRGRPRAP